MKGLYHKYLKCHWKSDYFHMKPQPGKAQIKRAYKRRAKRLMESDFEGRY